MKRFKELFTLLKQNLPQDAAASLPSDIMSFAIVKTTLKENKEFTAKIIAKTVTKEDFREITANENFFVILDPLEDEYYESFVRHLREIALLFGDLKR